MVLQHGACAGCKQVGYRRTLDLANALQCQLASHIRQTKWGIDADSDHMQHMSKSLSTGLQHMALKELSRYI